MQKRRKSSNKENNKLIKRVPLSTIPVFACTEELALPTYPSTEFKTIMKSLELRKPTSGNPYKKAVSRKSTCKSVKQSPSYQPPKLKSLMKQFKELKLLHENEKSKSRSPASGKSKSIDKYLPKKISFRTFGYPRNSEPNLTLKLERTVKKLNETNFFREEDSLIPLSSSSDLRGSSRQGEVLITESDQIVDMTELRMLCSTASLSFKKTEGLAFKTYDLFKQTMAALKIQRAWRNYQTKRLIKHYAFLYQQQFQSIAQRRTTPKIVELQEKEEIMQREKENAIFVPQMPISAQEKADNGAKQEKEKGREVLRGRKRAYLERQKEEEEAASNYQQIVKKMKIEQLQKWNQIISIISASKSQDPGGLEKLLQRLAQQSQLNKKELEFKAKQLLSNSQKKIQQEGNCKISEEENEARVVARHLRMESSSSQGLEEYDSKKYIDYLDGDIYVGRQKLEQPFSSGIKQLKRISNEQKELLLSNLHSNNSAAKIGETVLSKSQSFGELQTQGEDRPSIRRSTSEKYLKRTLEQMWEESREVDEQINLDLLTRQFLEGSDPFAQNFDMVYSQEKLRSKLAELHRFKNEHTWDYQDDAADRDELEDINFVGIQSEERSIESNFQKKALKEQVILQRQQNQIKIQEGEQSPQVKVQVVEAELRSDSEEGQENEARSQKSSTVATLLLNSLIVELLKEIASSDKLTDTFKGYSLSLRPRVKRVEGKKKKGFPTSKVQIQLFLDGLLRYLQKEQTKVFSNLQIPTGPSALEMLRYMHQYEEESQSDSEQDESNVMVIPNRVFDAFWSLKQKSIVIQIPENYDQTNSVVLRHQFQLLKSFNKIFYRSLFDTFNECLDCERNFGQYGRPFPWKRTPSFQHLKTEARLKSSVERARAKMLQLSTTYCGLIIESEERLSISEEYIQQVHEDRLSRMLAGDLMEGEERWVFYDDQETEILVEVANAIYTELLIDSIEALCDLE